MISQEIKRLYSRILQYIFITGLLVFQASCSGSPDSIGDTGSIIPPEPDPENYICYRPGDVIVIDGILNESDWEAVPWTDNFVDIEGDAKPQPDFRTRAKMLWDDSYLYVAAELEEPHIWATLRQRDTVIFYDNDFEIFIDPDGDTHTYYELEVNAYSTPWDLLLIKPYRDGGPAVNNWDINGLKVGTDIKGTINDPSDIDQGWSVEIAIPLQVLKECNRTGLPKAGDQWRIDFSRVEWRTIIENGKYKKEINPATGKPYPENNWVWSPQGRINMHMPEMWGYLQFSDIRAGTGTESFVSDSDKDEKWALRMVYYAETEYYKKFSCYAPDLKSLGLGKEDFTKTGSLPLIKATQNTFESYLPHEKGKQGWIIFQDGRIVQTGRFSREK
ncbi:MAG TPA: carbohydrate-binding family 9-like protein [Bacteroidales bacterium]|nr:carbohydrate-binding family 9-like protein [Bacteroidales bacterium]